MEGGNGGEHRAFLSYRPCVLTPSGHAELTSSIWPRLPVLPRSQRESWTPKLCVVAAVLIDVLQYVTESLTVLFPTGIQSSSTREVKGSCHSPQQQLEKPQQCVKSVRSESLRGEEGKKRRHCNGSLFYLSVCLSARTSESINTSQNAQFLLTCSPPFISGENKHGLWVLSSSAFFRASIVFVFALLQPAMLGNIHSVVPGTWRNLPSYYEVIPPLQNKRFFSDSISGVFSHRCLGVSRGQDRRDLILCINPLSASCSSQNNALHCPKHPWEQDLPLENQN